MKDILILGAGGHGKVVADILMSQGAGVLGFLDDDPTLWHTEILGLPVLGSIDHYADYGPAGLIIGIGINRVRQSIVHRLGEAADSLWISAVHPRAIIGRSVHIGVGTTIMAGAVVNPDTVIGNHTIVNTAATIDHDCAIGDFVHVARGAHLAGGVRVGDLSFVGIGANLIPYLTIGAGVTIGAGAAVVRDVPDGVTAKGVPARW